MSNAPSSNDQGRQDNRINLPDVELLRQPANRGETSSFVIVDEAAFAPAEGTQPTTIAQAVAQVAAAPSTSAVIESAVILENGPVVTNTKPAVEETKVASPLSDFEKLVSPLLTSGTTTEIGLITGFNKYIAGMKPGRPLAGPQGVEFQYALGRLLFRTVESSPPLEFTKLWNIAIAYFREHKDGVFNPRYAMRFTEYWAKDKGELNAFLQLVNILMATVSKGKKGLTKEVALEKALVAPFTESGRGRLMNFYK